MNRKLTVVEVAMEVAFPHDFLDSVAKRFGPAKAAECGMSTSVGGIGPLLRERIFEQGDAGLDVIGVTLLYESVWIQAWHEWGQLNLQKRNVGRELRELLKPTSYGFDLTFFDGSVAPVQVWELAYGKARTFFLSVPGVTDVVYPGPKDMPKGNSNPYAWSHEARLKQSWIVGQGALMLCKKMNVPPDLCVLSETPTIFAQPRMFKTPLQNDPFFAQTRFIFNDHTPLEYAHPIWDIHTLNTVRLDPAIYHGTPAWNAQKQTLDITSLLVGVCDGVYGVARKHGDVMRAMPSLKPFAQKIQYVTNGVRVQDWQAPEFARPKSLSDEQLFDLKKSYRRKLLEWAWKHCRLWPEWAKESENRKVVLWTRRITPYKRLDTLVKMLRVPEWRDRFLKLNLLILFGGRIHQQDNHAQDIVYDLLDLLDKDREAQKRVVFIDNFNIWDAPTLYKGADGSIMLADDTREASATGFMKSQMNGGAILATADGAVPEFVFFDKTPDHEVNGFHVPYVSGEPTPDGLLRGLEAFDQAFRDPARAAAIIRAAIAVTPMVSVKRTTEEMIQLYDRILASAASRPA